MNAQRKRFGFRDDAIRWIEQNGFVYHEKVGWQHPEGFRAIVEYSGRPPDPWALCVYKSTFQPNRWSITR